jgi:hypothetical protein
VNDPEYMYPEANEDRERASETGLPPREGQREPTEKVTFKDFSYTISNVGSSTAEARLDVRACMSGQCESSTSAGELVKQNGDWYVLNSTGAFGELRIPELRFSKFGELRQQLNIAHNGWRHVS